MPGFAYKGRAGGQSRKAHRKLVGPQLMGERRGDVSRGHCVNETVRQPSLHPSKCIRSAGYWVRLSEEDLGAM